MIGARSPLPDFAEPPLESGPAHFPVAPVAVTAKRRRGRAVSAGAAAAVALLIGAGATILVEGDGPHIEPVGVAGFAEDFVFTFLSSAGEDSEDSLSPFLGYAPTLTGMASGNFYVTHVTARDVRVRDNSWEVTVRAEVLARSAGGFTKADALHFAVRIVDEPGTGLRAVALPSPSAQAVASPVPARSEASLPADEVMLATVAGYLDWYLTESAPINGSSPAGGFAEAHLVSLDLDAGSATAGVVATTFTGHELRLDVPLTSEGGSWRVLDFSPESS